MLGKLNCYLAKFSIFLITAALIAGMVGCDGYTPPSKSLEIRTWYDLDDVRNNLAGNHTLMNNLDSTTAGYEELASPTANQGKGWKPIGTFTPWGPTAFSGLTGTFEAQGYEIRDLFINRLDEGYVGLFGGVDGGGVIKDIGAVNVTVTGDYYVGGLVGKNDGTVSNSYSSGNITGGSRVGGLLGGNTGTVSNSYSTSGVTGNTHVGGLVGENQIDGVVSDSFWDFETSGQATSDGGRGKTTAEMKGIATFSGAGWDIVAVASAGMHNPAYIWNIVDDGTYPFLSWES